MKQSLRCLVSIALLYPVHRVCGCLKALTVSQDCDSGRRSMHAVFERGNQCLIKVSKETLSTYSKALHLRV